MMQNYKVVTLCGSTRFKEQFMEAQKRLTLDGCIVISVGHFGHSCVPLVARTLVDISAKVQNVKLPMPKKQARKSIIWSHDNTMKNSALSLQTFLLSLQQITA